MDITLELDTRYHFRSKEKGGNQGENPPFTASNSFRPSQYSYSKQPHHKKNKKENNSQGSKDKLHSALLNKENRLINSEKDRRFEKCLYIYCGGKYPLDNCFKRSQNRPGD
ncbi:hypothetical protein O181_034971 [Austropuccinia psidii MF-1]|uniref:Uncharacterized protein n=1 Tax=Austropuccinia psidii MF-1 TaxID=1389203 RepID=A0A9Q3D1S6_9BASI|nr:hypothetical protein [Austropuccinia psidii MF-1]